MVSALPVPVLSWLLGVLGIVGLALGGVPATGTAYASLTPAAGGGTALADYEGTGVTAVSSMSFERAVYLGVWQPGSPWELGSLANFEAMVGKRAAIVHWYQGWGVESARLDLAQLRAVAARGSVPMITWEPWDYRRGVQQPEYALARIAAGAHDDYIRGWARELAGYEGTVLLRFAHEMNGDWYPWGRGVSGNTPAQFVAAWRHVHGLFRKAGATNVEWVWSPNVAFDAPSAFERYFPGDRYVDWAALDGYNHPNWGGWKSFDQLFGDSYARITRLSARPVMLAEFASSEGAGGKDAWIREAFERIERDYPRIRAVLWFNEAQPGQDWRVNSGDAAQRAFAEAVASPAFRGTWP